MKQAKWIGKWELGYDQMFGHQVIYQRESGSSSRVILAQTHDLELAKLVQAVPDFLELCPMCGLVKVIEDSCPHGCVPN